MARIQGRSRRNRRNREVNIVRSAAEKAGIVPPSPYRKKKTPISDEAQQEIIRIIRKDKKKTGAAGSSK